MGKGLGERKGVRGCLGRDTLFVYGVGEGQVGAGIAFGSNRNVT